MYFFLLKKTIFLKKNHRDIAKFMAMTDTISVNLANKNLQKECIDIQKATSQENKR